MRLPFEIVKDGEVIDEGITGGNPLTLPPGDYEVRYRWDGKDAKKTVTVVAGRQAVVEVP